MATILKQGKIKVNKAKYTCSRCDTVAEFESSDVRHDQRDGSYVKCPLCGAYIDETILHWKAV